MDALFSNDNIYYAIIALALLSAPAIYFYNNYLFNLSLTKELENIEELYSYANLYLLDFFSLTSSSQLAINFLDNKFLFNFFKNLVKLYPSFDIILMYFDFSEKIEIINFLDTIKKNSFESFVKSDIKKQTFFNLLYYINKKIFCLDI